MKRFVLSIAAQMGLIGMVGLANPAQAGDIVGVAVDSEPRANSRLWSVDFTTANAKLIGSTGVRDMEGLAISPEGALFGTDSRGILYRISLTTGGAIPIGNTRLGDIEGLDFKGETLLGTNFNNPTTFYSIDTTNASATPLVTTNPAEGPVRAMAVENSTTALSVSDTPIFQTLISTNLETGATSVLGTLHSSSPIIETGATSVLGTPDSLSLTAAMAFAPNRTLYGVDLSGRVSTIDPNSGALTPVFQMVENVTGIAIATVPEPPSWVSAAIGILILAVCACVQRRRAASA